jgi:putative PIN family toxin of toxin-antitoxin system
MICNAVIDTNVLVSSLLSDKADTATVQILTNVFNGQITPIVSQKIIDEYTEVLSRKKFKIRKEYADYIVKSIIAFGILIYPVSSGTILPDIDDIPFYDATITANDCIGKTYLVTGNTKHFPTESFIVNPRQLMELIE